MDLSIIYSKHRLVILSCFCFVVVVIAAVVVSYVGMKPLWMAKNNGFGEFSKYAPYPINYFLAVAKLLVVCLLPLYTCNEPFLTLSCLTLSYLISSDYII